MPEPYYTDGQVTLYHGRFQDVLPQLGIRADLILADPPYGETALEWDRWPDGWPGFLAGYGNSMWCFGSMRMFLDRGAEFAAWKLSQDVVWKKPQGSGFANDRFKRVHEHATHWYQGRWSDVHHTTPTEAYNGPDSRHGYQAQTGRQHTGAIGTGRGWVDAGTRLMQSVIPAPSMWRRKPINETEKSPEILRPLIEYGCRPGGWVLDPFAGSSSTLLVARSLGLPAIGIEKRESQCEAAAARLEQDAASPLPTTA